MPAIRKLTVEEVQTIERKGENKRDQVAREYDEFLTQFSTGDYAEITLDSGDTKPTVRHRFNAAALRAGVELSWMRGQSDTLKFHVISSPFSQQEAEETEEAALLDSEEENGTAEALAEYEAPVEEEVAAPEPVAAPKKPRSKKPVTDRTPFVEAP